MATPSSKSGPNGANSTSGPAPSPRTRDWGALRSSEPGSAFRGLTKGRGGGADRGGRGGGRGGRGARAGSGASRGGRGRGDLVNGTKPDTTPAKVDTFTTTKSTLAPGPSTPLAEKASSPVTSNVPRSKTPSRKASRNVPTLVLPPSSPIIETAPATAPARSSNQRRRSRQHGKSPVSAGPPKQGLSVDPSPGQSLLLPQRARTGPSSPTAPHKDAPPHFSTGSDVAAFDMKHNIDALVERVRAAAMETNRPTTPGSHIDWAGDDDDSLPDLDDWGVTTSTSVTGDKAGKADISPILVDGLRPLPEPLADGQEEDKAKLEDAAPPSIAIVPPVAPPREKWKSKRNAPAPLPLQRKATSEVAQKPTDVAVGTSSTTKTTAASASALDSTATHVSSPSAAPTRSSESPSKPVHPSLPVKPVEVVQSLATQAKPRPGTMPMRVTVPVKQPVAVEKSSDLIEPPVATVAEKLKSVGQPSITVGKPTSPVEAISQPVTAPPTASDDCSTDEIHNKQGLAASIHAPVSLPESTSLPDLTQSIPRASRAFNPTHQRAHTVGRTQAFHQLNTAPPFNQRFSRSGASTPRGSLGPPAHHGRTHSSPPTGSGLNPRVHSQRPIITGDAISRLVRTIGGIPPPRVKEVSVAKE